MKTLTTRLSLLKAAETNSTPHCPECGGATKPASGGNYRCTKCGACVTGAGKTLAKSELHLPEYRLRQSILRKSVNGVSYDVMVGRTRYGYVEPQLSSLWRAVDENGQTISNLQKSAEDAAESLLSAVYPDELTKGYDPANQIWSAVAKEQIRPGEQITNQAPTSDTRAIVPPTEIPAQVTVFKTGMLKPLADGVRFLSVVVGPDSPDYPGLLRMANSLAKADTVAAAQEFRTLSKSTQDHRTFNNVREGLLTHGLRASSAPAIHTDMGF
jgi:ribosomal protein L37AE/L43A